MKKVFVFLFNIGLLTGALFSGDKFFIKISGSMLIPNDSHYQDIYGSLAIHPEIKTGFTIYKDFYFWGGYGFLRQKGKTERLELPATSTQHYLSLGLGFHTRISGRLDYMAEFGFFRVSYKEEALDEEINLSDNGLRLDVGVIVILGKRFFTECSMGYLTASREFGQRSLKLGGFKTQLGFGMRF